VRAAGALTPVMAQRYRALQFALNTNQGQAMPGIVGIIGGAPKEQPLAIHSMIKTMLHEPIYVHGTHFEPSLGVYAGWVAHPGSCAQRLGRACVEGRLSLILSGQCFGGGANPASDRVVLE